MDRLLVELRCVGYSLCYHGNRSSPATRPKVAGSPVNLGEAERGFFDDWWE